MKTASILRFLASSLACLSLLHAEPETAPIPFSEIGAKATADYQGDAIGISMGPEMVRLHTGFQKLAGNVTSEGLTLDSTEEDGGSLKLTAISIGRDSRDAHSPVFLPTSGKVSVEEKLVRWSRPGLVEEYSVSADGVRQDFIIGTKPSGSGALRVELTLSGAIAATLGDGVRLTLDASGRELAYTRLRVEDATGRVLSAHFKVLAADRLAVRVDDAGAVYPVRIDPTFSDADWIGLNSAISGTNGRVNAIAFDGGDMYVGGSFSAISNISAKGIAKWNGSTWSSLGSGIAASSAPEVKCLTVSGGILYVGGNFTSAGGVSALRVASWDGSNWAALGSGLSGGSGGPVHALASYGTLVYAGGEFSTAGGLTANRVAVWNGSSWSALGSGVGGSGTVRVNALAMSGSDLIVGGQFTTAGGLAVNRIAKWSGSAWSALGTGIDNNWVNCVAVNGGDIYVGGNFSAVGGITMNRVAKWNGSTWSALGAGVSSTIYSMAMSGSTLYAAGDFSLAGGVAVSDIASWNGSTWSAVGSGTSESYQVYSIALNGNTLYAGGDFERVGGVGARNLAKWNGGSWASIAPGVSNSVSALIVIGTNLYIGGRFVSAGAVTASRIAKWDGSNWSALGTGIEGGYQFTQVNALAQIAGVLYAGGDFTRAGGVTAYGVAKWNGSAWSALGTGVQNGKVYSLAASGGNLYIGGNFTTVDGVTCNHIAKWNGSAWSALGTGMTPPSYLGEGVVNCLLANGTDLYAGGVFTAAGGVPSNGIAKWNGTNWAALGTGVNERVTALAWIGSDLYAGGRFTTAGGVTANRIAKWNGSVWAPLGSGLNNSANALAVNNGYLYVGGNFSTAGGVTVNGIARWSGSVWTALGSGTNAGVGALLVSANTLYVGGGFTQVGTTYSPFIAKAGIVNDTVPEISISGSGVEIADGDASPATIDGTDFGSRVHGTEPLARSFTITNLGGVALNLTGTAPSYVSLSGSSSFSVTAQPAAATIPAEGGSATFTVTYNPSTSGIHVANISIGNSDANKTPYNFTVQGSATTPSQAMTNTLAAVGITGLEAAPTATPFNDGVENLLKYAFNMNLAGPDSSTLPPGTGTSGLPSITTPEAAPTGTLRFEFLRRKNSGLIYTPRKSTTLDDPSWSPITATPVVTSIDDQWERVVYTEAPDPVPAPACFGRVSVSLP